MNLTHVCGFVNRPTGTNIQEKINIENEIFDKYNTYAQFSFSKQSQ